MNRPISLSNNKRWDKFFRVLQTSPRDDVVDFLKKNCTEYICDGTNQFNVGLRLGMVLNKRLTMVGDGAIYYYSLELSEDTYEFFFIGNERKILSELVTKWFNQEEDEAVVEAPLDVMEMDYPYDEKF